MKKMIGTLELVGESKKTQVSCALKMCERKKNKSPLKKYFFFADIEKTYFNCDCQQQFIPKSLNDMHVLLFTNIDIYMA